MSPPQTGVSGQVDGVARSTAEAIDGGDAAEPEPRTHTKRRIEIEIVEDAGDWSALGDIAQLEGQILRAAEAVAAEPAVAAFLPTAPAVAGAVVALSCDESVAGLNAQFRGKAKPTNVLSFPAPHSAQPLEDGEPRALGDIVLAVETITREAAEMGLPVAHHLTHLVVHGLLHLLGYDHLTAEDAEAMEALEIRILAKLGIGDPYAGSEVVEAPS